MFLLDTEVIWALRNAKRESGEAPMIGWVATQPRTSLFISALTLAELGAVAMQIERTDKASASGVRQWIDSAVPAAFEGRTVSVDAVVTRRAAALGYPHLRDGLFAATALEHGLTVATRSPASYRSGKVRTFNPWSYSAGADAESGDWRQASRSGPVWLKNLFVRG